MALFTTANAVAAYLGRTFTSAQTTQATALLDAADAFILRETSHTWQTTPTPIVGEQHDLLRDWLVLDVTPVSSIQQVVVRTRAINDPGITLVQGTDYELQDPSTGFVVLTAGYGDPTTTEALDQYVDTPESGGANPILQNGAAYDIPRGYALVDYTPAAPVPADLSLAATMLVAHWLMYSLDPARYQVAKNALNGNIEVTYDIEALRAEVPAEALRIIRGNKRVVFA